MIGMRNRELHCTDGLSYKSLRLCKTRVSPGWVLTGFSPDVEVAPLRFSAYMICPSLAEQGQARPMQVFHIEAQLGPDMEFLEA